MWAAYTAYPAYRSKNGHVNSFQERLQGCFRYSMNGKVPNLGDPVLVALESYAYFLAKGLPTGKTAPGRGFPALPKPPATGQKDSANPRAVRWCSRRCGDRSPTTGVPA
jgi:thiosulfate dehydrogenase